MTIRRRSVTQYTLPMAGRWRFSPSETTVLLWRRDRRYKSHEARQMPLLVILTIRHIRARMPPRFRDAYCLYAITVHSLPIPTPPRFSTDIQLHFSPLGVHPSPAATDRVIFVQLDAVVDG